MSTVESGAIPAENSEMKTIATWLTFRLLLVSVTGHSRAEESESRELWAPHRTQLPLAFAFSFHCVGHRLSVYMENEFQLHSGGRWRAATVGKKRGDGHFIPMRTTTTTTKFSRCSITNQTRPLADTRKFLGLFSYLPKNFVPYFQALDVFCLIKRKSFTFHWPFSHPRKWIFKEFGGILPHLRNP